MTEQENAAIVAAVEEMLAEDNPGQSDVVEGGEVVAQGTFARVQVSYDGGITLHDLGEHWFTMRGDML